MTDDYVHPADGLAIEEPRVLPLSHSRPCSAGLVLLERASHRRDWRRKVMDPYLDDRLGNKEFNEQHKDWEGYDHAYRVRSVWKLS